MWIIMFKWLVVINGSFVLFLGLVRVIISLFSCKRINLIINIVDFRECWKFGWLIKLIDRIVINIDFKFNIINVLVM